MQLPRLRNIRCQMKNLNSVILSLNEKMPSFAKQMIFSGMHSVFSQKTGRRKDKRTSLVRQRISSQIWCKSDLQISENQRIRLLSLAEKSEQARCKAASSGQNTRNPFRTYRQQELRC